MMKKAVVLLSGGLDSAVTLHEAFRRGFEPYCLIFDYGQRHRKEIRQAVRIAGRAGVKYKIVKISFPWKGSALLDKTASLPRDRADIPKEIPATYVPGRNIIFLSFAASYAEVLKARAVFIGVNAIDYSGYPDCRPEFIRAFQAALNKGMKTGTLGRPVKIYAPLIHKTKARIIRMGSRLKVPFHLTWSCYQGGRTPCGRCDSCLLRQKGFTAAGLKDPLAKA